MQNAGGSQKGPVIVLHAAPSAARATHVAAPIPLPSQVPSEQPSTWPFTVAQACPVFAVPVSAVQLPMEQRPPGAHKVPRAHIAPVATGVTQVPVESHSSPGVHWRAPVHGCPAEGGAAQAPQAEVVKAQKPVWHCPAASHALPVATGPSAWAHAEGGLALMRKSLQSHPGIAATQDSTLEGLLAFWGAPRVRRQFALTRASQFDSV